MTEQQTAPTCESILDQIEPVVRVYQDGMVSARAVERAKLLARTIDRLRDIISLELAAGELMRWYGSPLGFSADKPNERDRTPYKAAEVREAIIQGVLHGACWIGGEIAIISTRCYLQKAFFERACREHPGVTDLVGMPGIPTMRDDQTALVPYVVRWKQDGKPRELRFEGDYQLVCKSNKAATPDTVIGKARRKALCAALEAIRGQPQGTIPEADPVEVREAMNNEALPAAAANAVERSRNGAQQKFASLDQIKRFWTSARDHGWTDDETRKYLVTRFNVKASSELRDEDMVEALAWAASGREPGQDG